MLERILSSKTFVSFVLAAATAIVLAVRYPFPSGNLVLQLISLKDHPVYLGIFWAYSIMLFSTPYFIYSAVLSGIYVFAYGHGKKIKPIPLPPYPAPAKRQSLFLVIGELHHPTKVIASPVPQWLSTPERGLYAGKIYLGAVGSGKTTCGMRPDADQLIGYQASDPACRIGGLVLEVKGDFCHQVQEIMTKYEREGDYIEISLNSEYRWNPFENELDSYALAYNIASLLNNLFGKGKEPFWQQAYTNLVKFVILLHKVVYDYVTPFHVYECVISPSLLARRIEDGDREFPSREFILIDPDAFKKVKEKHEDLAANFQFDPYFRKNKAERSRDLEQKLDPLAPEIRYEIHREPFVMRVDELNPVPSTSAYSTYYSYDATGNLLQILQGQQTRTYTYDSMGRRLSECLPETANKCSMYTYTDFNAMKTRTDPRGIVITYGFDSQNRVNDVQYSDGTPEVKFVYGASGAANNGGGRLISSTDGTGSKTYQYDVMGRLTQVSQIIGVNTYITKYTYAGARVKTITYPSGANGAGTQVTYSYDNIGRLSSVLLGANTIYTAGSYNAAGQVLTNTLGNGISGAFSYNNRLQLGSLRYANASAALLDLAYNYGGATDNGEILGITDNADSTRSTSYVYDGIGRLQQAQTVNQLSPLSWNLQFAYDRYGNRLSQTPVGGQMAMPSSQLAVDPATNHVIATGVTYDAAGNMTSDSAFNYAFDANNAVSTVFMPGVITPSANYSYDSAGNRVIRNGNYYIYLGGHVIAEYANGAGAASPTTEYIYVGSRRVATLSNGTVTYHYWDHLSVRTSANAAGNSVRGYGSFPFGETWYETGTAQKWKFTTYENDSESGLNYANARFHSPRLGRFMSLDPLAGNLRNPQSFNRYAYVRNNPISSTDSTGMFCDMDCDDDGGGGGGGGGGEGGTPCGPFECSGDPGPDPTPDPDPNDLPDAPEPKPDVLQNNNASADLDFVFNGANQTLQPSNDLTDLSALSLPTTTGSFSVSGTLSGGDDVLVGMDLWHNTDQCQGCGTMWRQASNTGNMIFAGTGIVLGGVPLAAEGALVAVNLSAQAIGWYSGLTGGAGVVLGKFPEYIEAAEEMGANVFNLSSRLYNVLDRMGASWTANQAFLDASIYRGQQFYLSSVASSGAYWMELQYLSSRGFGPDTWQGAFIRF
jgi:RHS repeat-associated protein